MIVVVSGQTRKAGKTAAMCAIINATRELAWTAVKLSPHGHSAEDVHNGDTGRYLRAGAAAAFLLASIAELPASRPLIVESNAAAEALKPDLLVFVAGGSEWKDSAHRLVSAADVVLRTAEDVEKAIAAVKEEARGRHK